MTREAKSLDDCTHVAPKGQFKVMNREIENNRKRKDYHSLDYDDMMKNKDGEAELRNKVFWNNTIIGEQIEKDIQELTQEYWEVGFSTGRSIAITETNSKWKQAIQKTLKELREKLCGESKSFVSNLIREEIDTTFKKHLGGLAE